MFACASGSSCGWTTTAQPSTSWCCLSATMKLSNWRSSTGRWRSMPTSSVSPVNASETFLVWNKLNERVFILFPAAVFANDFPHKALSIKVLLVEYQSAWLLRCVLTRSWGDAGGLPEHRSLLCGREETPAGWQVLPEVWPVQQSTNSPSPSHSLNSINRIKKGYSLPHLLTPHVQTTCPPLSVRPSGPEPLPEVSQHWWQPGCRDGYRDGECVKVNNPVQMKSPSILLSVFLCVCVCVTGGSGQGLFSD